MAINTAVKEILEQFGETLVNDLRESIIAKGHGSSTNNASDQSSLIGSVKYKIFGRDTQVTFSLSMADYYKYIDEGTKKAGKKGGGGKKMLASLESWIQGKSQLREVVKKNQLFYKDEKGKFKERKEKLKYSKSLSSFAYAVKRSIHKRGIIKRFGYRGSSFYSSVINDGRVDRLKKDISSVLKRSVKVELVEVINKRK